jgi:hypothetical protein
VNVDYALCFWSIEETRNHSTVGLSIQGYTALKHSIGVSSLASNQEPLNP